ncbi:MAG: bifunctional diaminohydroxyphosphoribosylaminopyrimidine deaminase/5-amino-6-(5-phosphoribosylamino)uracil reductase RibD [Phascolarctobacterium sp.]|nr:bifunctional diaminohydroxyphosphoribosylaminopyrimidine deaminase/5-amino-6-(5-phosphoribosylamino)uracil reductase RibD [Phascolarctobacterium sp.]
MNDEYYMQLALELALKAEGNTSPNPMVGCVLVNEDGEIVGEGYHHKAGEPHAEVMAIRDAGKASVGCTAYVTLEPCSHFGRTGPCCRALFAAGIRRVVVACTDPNPKVAGKGLKYLQDMGIEVKVGVCEEEALRLNERFFTWITKRRPFITLKYAMTLDGKIATKTGDSKWITGEEARTYAHRLRKQHDAVLVGIGTVLADDPELTTRMVQGKNPIRIVLDAKLQTNIMNAVLNPAAPTIIITSTEADPAKMELFSVLPNVELVQLPFIEGKVDIDALIQELTAREITSLLVEGGSSVLGAFKDAGYADRICAFIAPKLLGGKESLTAVGGEGCELMQDSWELEQVEYHQLGSDLLVTGLVKEAR